MLAVEKTHRTEISLHGEGAEAILSWIRRKFPVEVVVPAAPEEADGADSVPVRATEWYGELKRELLAGARLKHGMSQSELAEKSGVSQSLISQYESGRRALTLRAAIRLGEALGEPPEKLLAD